MICPKVLIMTLFIFGTFAKDTMDIMEERIEALEKELAEAKMETIESNKRFKAMEKKLDRFEALQMIFEAIEELQMDMEDRVTEINLLNEDILVNGDLIKKNNDKIEGLIKTNKDKTEVNSGLIKTNKDKIEVNSGLIKTIKDKTDVNSGLIQTTKEKAEANKNSINVSHNYFRSINGKPGNLNNDYFTGSQ